MKDHTMKLETYCASQSFSICGKIIRIFTQIPVDQATATIFANQDIPYADIPMQKICIFICSLVRYIYQSYQ